MMLPDHVALNSAYAGSYCHVYLSTMIGVQRWVLPDWTPHGMLLDVSVSQKKI